MPRAGLFLSFDGVLHPAGIERMPAAGSCKAGPEHFEWAYDLIALLDPYPEIELGILSRWRLLHSESALRALIPHHLARRVVALASSDLPKPRAAADCAMHRGWTQWVTLESETGHFEPGSPRLILCDPKLGVTDPLAHARLRAWLCTHGSSA